MCLCVFISIMVWSTKNHPNTIIKIIVRCHTRESSFKTAKCCTGLCELGPEVTKALVVPRLRVLGAKIEQCMDGISAYEKNAAVHIKGMLLVSWRVIYYTHFWASDWCNYTAIVSKKSTNHYDYGNDIELTKTCIIKWRYYYDINIYTILNRMCVACWRPQMFSRSGLMKGLVT